jgi:DNA-binding PadR family transcriptional regulator
MSETESDRDLHLHKQGGSAIRSPLTWALLGLVIERASHGYELAQRFKVAYGETLPLSSHKNIYRHLDTLRHYELIEETAPSADEKPARNRLPKPHFSATAQGERAYQQWLTSQMEEQRERQRLFARQLAMLEPGAALSVIERYERECLEEAEAAREAAEAGGASRSVAQRLADADERLALEVRLTWIAYARTQLKALISKRSAGQ